MEYKQDDLSEEILRTLRGLIDEHDGMLRREQILEAGIDYRRVLDYVRKGQLVRIRNGYYTDRADRFTEEELVAALFPDAKLCMESALYAYGYLKERPDVWHLAVNKNTSKARFRMDTLRVIPYYTEPDTLQLGADAITLDGLTFGIYDRDRLICDCLKYESKMEHEVFRQAVLAYIMDPQKDTSALLDYARGRKVVKKVQSMIGVWL